jgi:CO/xanthine dehydrogenase Mo-binding subunit
MSSPTSHHEQAVLSPDVAALLAVPEQRVEGQLKVTGQARYAADLQLPGTLWAAFLGSPVPHARIVSIDTSAARAIAGVHAVLSGDDVRGARFGRRLQDWPVLAWDRVRFIGERVAAVAAEGPEAADEAARAIQVEYEELPPIFEPHEALADGAPILHEEASEYTYLGGTRPAMPHPNLQGYHLVQKGDPDIERAFARADRLFEYTFSTPREHQGHIEPHATVVWIDQDGIVHVVSTNKTPFSLRQQMASTTGLPPERIVVDSAFIGGDFGGKGTSIDEYACYYLARATGRPIKAVMSYVDELQAANPRHAAVMRLRTGVDRNGRFVAHESEMVFNGGAYAGGKPAPALVPIGGLATLAAYNVPNTRLELKTVYTNTVPGGHMRAPGEVQALFAGESHVDMIARELDMDPLTLRLLNAVREGDSGPANDHFREPRAVEVLETLRRETQWGQKSLPPNRGRGISLGVRHIGGGKTSVAFRLLSDGTIEALTGLPDQGGGAYTVIRRVAAAALSVEPERIVVTYGTTASAPEDPGAGGSRVTHIVGQAAHNGAVILKERLEELASEVMGWPAGQARLEHDRFAIRDPSAGLESETASFAEVAARIARGTPVEVRGSYDGSGHGPDEAGDFNFAAYMVEAEVDPETGRVRIHGVVLVADVGAIINPVAHQGQLEGGFVYGLGAGLMEHLPIQDGKVLTLSLGEYKLPSAADTPPFRTVLLPTTIGPGPFGAKMAGELSNTGVAPAIANAIAAAVGARLTTLPLTAEGVLQALKG